MLSRRAAICAALALSLSAPALAHDAPRVETEVSYNVDGALEVVHVLQLSTAQRLLFKGGVIEENDLTGLRARAQTAIYAAEKFELFADNEKIDLEILGAEVEGPHLYIYQTGEIAALPTTWSARNAILRDLNPRFDNTINVPSSDGIKTLVFNSRDLNEVRSTN